MDRKEYLKAYHINNREKRLPKMLERNRRIYSIRRAFIDSRKDVPCADCGLRYPPYVMQFDHISVLKRFDISRGLCLSLEKLMFELCQCLVVCANCHAIRTHNRLDKGYGKE